MPLTAYCPHCRQAVDLDQLPIERCPNCGRAFDPEFSRELEARFKPERPAMLTLQMFLGYILGAMLLLTVPAAFMPHDAAATREAMEMLGLPPLSMPPPLAMGLLALAKAVLLLWSSYALQKQRYIGRALLTWLVVVITIPQTLIVLPWANIPGLPRQTVFATIFMSLLCILLAWCYLYKRGKIVAYYANLLHLEVAKAGRPVPTS